MVGPNKREIISIPLDIDVSGGVGYGLSDRDYSESFAATPQVLRTRFKFAGQATELLPLHRGVAYYRPAESFMWQAPTGDALIRLINEGRAGGGAIGWHAADMSGETA